LRVLLLIFLLSFAVTLQTNYAKETILNLSDQDKKAQSNDSLNTQNQTIGYGLKYPSISRNINSLLSLNIPAGNLNKHKGFMLDDGTRWSYESDLNSIRLLTMMGLIGAIDIAGYYRLKDLQYNRPTTKFHSIGWNEDFEKYKWMDKYGHFLHSYFASDLFSSGYRWSGFSGENSVYYGALSGWLWMLQIEIADAFFEAWGFSWGDLLFNTLGSGFSLLQQLYPEILGGLQPKVSYHTSDALRERRYNNGANNIIDDYEGLTWWLGVNVYHYMPKTVQNTYPDWLKPFGFAIGHSATGIADDPQGGKREIFFGLDFDLRKLSYGNESGLIRFLKNELNIIRLPLPAVKITPHGVWYGLYF
jgi:hypothetical protein